MGCGDGIGLCFGPPCSTRSDYAALRVAIASQDLCWDLLSVKRAKACKSFCEYVNEFVCVCFWKGEVYGRTRQSFSCFMFKLYAEQFCSW